MKQFEPGEAPQVTETSAGPAMVTLLITSGELAGSRIAEVRTDTDVPPFGGFVTDTTPPVVLALASCVKFRMTMN